MEKVELAKKIIRFGAFEVDLRAEELCKNGSKIRLRGQPFQVLVMLLERPGEVVTREQLQQRLWPDGTFVDFDHSLNTAINKIRQVLEDSAENSRFVETLARRGYRFVARVEAPDQTARAGSVPANVDPTLTSEEGTPAGTRKKEGRGETRRLTRVILIGAVLVLLVGSSVWYYTYRSISRTSQLPPLKRKGVRLTSFPGIEREPAISPDGKMVAFVWDGENRDNFDMTGTLRQPGPHLESMSYLLKVDRGALSPIRLPMLLYQVGPETGIRFTFAPTRVTACRYGKLQRKVGRSFRSPKRVDLRPLSPLTGS